MGSTFLTNGFHVFATTTPSSLPSSSPPLLPPTPSSRRIISSAPLGVRPFRLLSRPPPLPLVNSPASLPSPSAPLILQRSSSATATSPLAVLLDVRSYDAACSTPSRACLPILPDADLDCFRLNPLFFPSTLCDDEASGALPLIPLSSSPSDLLSLVRPLFFFLLRSGFVAFSSSLRRHLFFLRSSSILLRLSFRSFASSISSVRAHASLIQLLLAMSSNFSRRRSLLSGFLAFSSTSKPDLLSPSPPPCQPGGCIVCGSLDETFLCDDCDVRFCSRCFEDAPHHPCILVRFPPASPHPPSSASMGSPSSSVPASSSTGEVSRHTDVHRLVTSSDYDSYVRGEPPRLPLRDLLDASDPGDRKQLIGSFLFPYLEPILGALSAKVVGMLLEFTLGELYNFIFDAPSLADIVVTALVALDGYTSSPSPMPTVAPTSHPPLAKPVFD